MQVRHYAIVLEAEGRRWNLATDKIILTENNGDGDKKIVFLPRLLKVSVSDTAFSFEGQPPIPSVDITLWDAANDIRDSIRSEGLEYESLKATFYFLDEDSNILSRFVGYLTDVNIDQTQIEGKLRMDEDSNGTVELERFSFDTFQFFRVFKPVDVKVVSDFNLVNNTPWEVFKVEKQRVPIARQNVRIYDPISGDGYNIITNFPSYGMPFNYNAQFIKLGTTTNEYIKYVEDDVFFFKLGLHPIPAPAATTIDFRIFDPIAVTNKIFSFTTAGGETYDQVMEGLEANINADPNFTAQYFSNSGELYIQSDPNDVDDAYGSVADLNLIFAFDVDTIGSEKRLAPVKTDLFDTSTNGTAFKIAVLGDAQFQSMERVGYTDCLKGQVWIGTFNGIVYNRYFQCLGSFEENGETILNSDVYFLSGIPTQTSPDPRGLIATMTALDATITNTTELYEKYGVQHKHTPFESISPLGAIDTLYVKANGLTVYDTNADKSTVGYVNVGGKLENNESNTTYNYFHRYKISTLHYSIYDDNRNDGTVIDEVLALEIHSRPGFHDYAVNTRQARWELPDKIDIDTKVLLADFNLTVAYFDFLIDNIDDATWALLASTSSSAYRDTLKDRLRGQRIDMMDNFDEAKRIVAKSANGNATQSIEKDNANLVNNATGKFAICTASEIILNHPTSPTQIFERAYFYIDPQGDLERLWIESDIDDNNGASGVDVDRKFDIKSAKGRDNFYLNYFNYHDDVLDATLYENFYDALELQAREFFASKTYRTFYNPVPENSQDLGRAFPIIYGTVEKMKALQVISKKVIGQEMSAGDDTYIFASHPCEVKDASDIKIEVLEDVGENQTPRTEQDFDPNLRHDIIKSPFPDFIEDHWEVNPDPSVSGAYPRLQYYGRLENPYHEVGEFRTNDDNFLYGFQLSGGLWNSRAGKLDKRYPIRNGVGTTPLRVTVSGWIDKDGSITGFAGSLIEHPLDIIQHFLTYYGEYPYNEDFVNIESKEIVKSKTREFAANVLIEDDIKISDFIYELCRQFGIKYYIKNGQINFVYPDFDQVNYGKPLSEGINLLGGLTEGGYGYKNIYNEIEIKYDFNAHTGKFESIYSLGPDNNVFCAKADRSQGGKKKFSMEARFLRSHWIASRVADFYARTLCRSKVKFTCKAIVKDGIVFEPGDVVPVTSSKNGFEQEPMIVESVKETDQLMELQLVYFI